ncbi:bifunctional glycosyltransferase/CDP-glycerol:glycerophosphate glycerophosphotransferase [Halomonas getboli]|uniref:bifunctional glycosyltransferase/CDP-glycerol:glycerophosphate glycerophosphotransferase n=1 Tax=Halomonas getboli TaxID=2935862 RepID=UPI0020002D06|nr:bifunctional glycosyltransferase family 2 protein/CDP-glycerol:glycerophosphate glycerophosphotransferase [Halomonas getboli]
MKHVKALLLPIYHRAPKKLREPLKRGVLELLRPGRRTKVSVIVPVFNVESYLPACLDSILAQSHRNIEVVCVDDGSPDNSIEVLRDYAAKDSRVKIVRKANGGLGAARNTGVENSNGEMIYFADSDDTIPPRAVEHLLTSLKRSGSDFAVGSLMRDTPTGRHVPRWAQQLHATTRTRLTLADEPDALKNVFAWTKMFRRQFFLNVVGGYPDGLYEDQVPAAKAYTHGTFDIIKDVVCFWRIREDESSITQQKATMKDLKARWEVIASLAEQMADAPAPVLRVWQSKVVGFDMRPYYEQVPRTDDEYWAYLQSRVRSFVDFVGYDLLASVEISDRLQAAAVYHGYREDVAELLRRRESQTWKVPGTVFDGTPRVDDEYFEGLQLLPDGVLEVLSAPGDVALVQHVESVTVVGEELVVRGIAYLTNLSQSEAGSVIALEARAAEGSGKVLPVRLTRYREPAADMRAADPWNEHSESGFEAAFALAELREGRWDLSITLDVNGIIRTSPLAAPDPASAGRLPAFGTVIDHSRWYLVDTRKGGGLQLRHTVTPRLAVEQVWSEDSLLCVCLAEGVCPDDGRFVAISGTSRITGSLSICNGRAVVSFSIPVTSRYRREWALWWQSGKQCIQLAWADSHLAVSTERACPYVVRASATGDVVILGGPLVGEITGATLSGNGLQVTGWMRRDASLASAWVTAKLFSQFVPGSSVAIGTVDGGFDATLPLTNDSGSSLSRVRGYAVVFDIKGYGRVWPQVSDKMLESMPVEDMNFDSGITLTVTPRARALWVRLRNALAEDERSRRSQHLLQRAYSAEHSPVEAVLFETFNGKTVGDSPLALSRELHRRGSTIEQYWSVESLAIPVPEWATPLLRYSKRWYEVLASAQLLVNNNNWPWFFIKRPYQTYLQTWHGTPLKQIGNDVPGANLSLTYRSLMVREAAAWDYLIAQNEYSAKIFPRAFGYSGEVMQLGYPRNDSLVDDTAQPTRERVRAALGLADDSFVLLYAPTWRDNLKGHGGYSRVLFLDFDVLREGVGENVVVLYRGHSNTANASGGSHEGVIDVTRYPDVNEIMLASDALVTDYSSIFYDYAVMRKPIYFLVPDLEQYGSATRGFYKPLEQVAPGPLCKDTAALVHELSQDFQSSYGERFDQFLATYAPQDDGSAAARVLDALAPSCGMIVDILTPTR